MTQIRIGLIGCGDISGIYLKNLSAVFLNFIFTACADLDMSRPQRALKCAQTYGIPQVQTADELISNPDVDLVLNLTVPAAHFEICHKALTARKHVYTEKPLSLDPQQGMQLVDLAKENGLYLGCAPDTFLGAGIQTCRKILDDGIIGRPTAATAFFGSRGPETSHPNPEFLYKKGAGPMMDLGPYYITALVSLLGPAKVVCGMVNSAYEERTITSDSPLKGKTFRPETPSHVTGTITFENGAVATVLTSFDLPGHKLPYIEIYGTKGTLRVPNPDKFEGPVELLLSGEKEFREIALTHPYSENSRGIGAADMMSCLSNGRKHKASGELALHVLEIMTAFLKSAEEQRFIPLSTNCERPEAFDPDASYFC